MTGEDRRSQPSMWDDQEDIPTGQLPVVAPLPGRAAEIDDEFELPPLTIAHDRPAGRGRPYDEETQGGFDEGIGDTDAAGRPPAPTPGGTARTIVTSLLLPGVGQWRRHPIIAALLVSAGIVGPLVVLGAALMSLDDPVRMVAHSWFLRFMIVAGVLAILARLVSLGIAQQDRPDLRRIAAIGIPVMLAIGAPVVYGLDKVNTVRQTVAVVFQQRPGRARQTVPDDSLAPQLRTILFVGSDEAADRPGIRTDSMMLIMIDQRSGRSQLVSVPRNLTRLQWPKGSVMQKQFPEGFTDLTNAVVGAVNGHPDWAKEYDNGDGEPGIHALMQGLSYTFNVTIDDYVKVNSCAVVNLVDAIGGVTIHLETRLPTKDSNFACVVQPQDGWLGPGDVHLDGKMAWAYARTRSADSDYGRMSRQRTLLQEIVRQANFAEVLTNFDSIAGTLRSSIKTSLTVGNVRSLIKVLRDAKAVPEGVGLSPPLFQPGHPDFRKGRQILRSIRTALVGGAPNGASFDPDGGGIVGQVVPSTVARSTVPTRSSTTSTSAG